MEETKIDIKKGIKFHKIVSNKFKTDLIAVFITVPLQRDTITYNALLPMVLRRGTNNIKTQQDINKELENMYGASFDCGVDKNGDNQVMKFYLEILDNQYVLENEDILKQGLKLLIDIVCNPYIENNAFLKGAYWSPSLTTIVNQTDRSFDWGQIINGTSGYNFVTGTVINSYGNVEVVSSLN